MKQKPGQKPKEKPVVYNRIKAVLAETRVKNLQLAEHMGVHGTTVSDWCTNKNQPSIQQLFRIAEFLRVSPKDLLAEEKRIEPVMLQAAEDPVPYVRKKKGSKK